jgi:uncharacterized protein
MVPHWMSGAFFLVALTISWALINNYLARRVQSAFGLKGKWSRRARYLFVVLSFTYIYGRIVERTFGVADWVSSLFHIGAYWVGFGTISLCVFALADLGRIAVGLRRHLMRRSEGEKLLTFAMRPWSRMGMTAVLAVSLFACSYSIYAALAPPRVVRVQVKAPAGSGVAEPVRMVFMSDLHLGHLGTSDQLEDTLAVVAELKPDVVVIPGDIVDERSDDVRRGMALLGGIDAPQGVVATLGNHEQYNRLEFFLEECKKNDIRVLRQQSWQLPQGLILAGIDDLRVLRDQELDLVDAFKKTLSPIPWERFTVLLFHRPVMVQSAFDLGADVILSGHTHGGQLPPFQILSPIANDGHLSGAYHYGDNLLYVTSGAGFWGPPMRLFAPREVVLVEIAPHG